MHPLFLTMAGGAIGAGSRHLLGVALIARFGPGFPWWTLTANLLGGLLMGMLAGVLLRDGGTSESLRLFAGVGVLGGFTTFSAFSLETWQMIERGAIPVALAYVVASVVGAVGMLALGLTLSRSVS
jgi:CrcB protein